MHGLIDANHTGLEAKVFNFRAIGWASGKEGASVSSSSMCLQAFKWSLCVHRKGDYL